MTLFRQDRKDALDALLADHPEKIDRLLVRFAVDRDISRDEFKIMLEQLIIEQHEILQDEREEERLRFQREGSDELGEAV